MTTRAVVLRAVDYRDSDRIITLFTEQLGKVSAIARAARRIFRKLTAVNWQSRRGFLP